MAKKLKKSFNFYQAMGMLKASIVPAIHIAETPQEAKRKAEERPNVFVNCCTENGPTEMATELLNLMNRRHQEIKAIGKNEESELMTDNVTEAQYLWISRKNATAQRVPWKNIGVVIGRNKQGRLFLRHCQPNP